LLVEDEAFLAVANPDVTASFGEAVSPPVLFTLVGVLPEEFWAYALDTIDGVAMRLKDSNDILKATPTTIHVEFLIIFYRIRSIVYNNCIFMTTVTNYLIVLYRILAK
jgi:hypothetical protein